MTWQSWIGAQQGEIQFSEPPSVGGAWGLWPARQLAAAGPGLQRQRRGPASPVWTAAEVTGRVPPGCLHQEKQLSHLYLFTADVGTRHQRFPFRYHYPCKGRLKRTSKGIWAFQLPVWLREEWNVYCILQVRADAFSTVGWQHLSTSVGLHAGQQNGLCSGGGQNM